VIPSNVAMGGSVHISIPYFRGDMRLSASYSSEHGIAEERAAIPINAKMISPDGVIDMSLFLWVITNRARECRLLVLINIALYDCDKFIVLCRVILLHFNCIIGTASYTQAASITG